MASPASSLLDAIAAGDGQLTMPAVSQATPAGPIRPPATSRFVLLSIASTLYAVPEANVTELERVPPITAVPRVPAWIRGVTNLRGDIVSVIDVRLFVGLEPHPTQHSRLLVVRLLDEPLTTAFIVDAVDRIVTVAADEIKLPASPLDGPLAPFLSGVCMVGDRLAAILDIDRLLRSPDIRQFDEPTEPQATASPASPKDN